MEVVAAGLEELGYATSMAINEISNDRRNIVFGPRMLRAEDVDRVPPSTILYNFEPLAIPVYDSRRDFVTHFAPRFPVWDYSAANVRYLTGLGCRAQHVPLGYAPPLTRVERAPVQDIDIFFYGDMSARRVRVLDELRDTGLNVVAVSDLYGQERDALIGRAKVVLNVHNHDDVKALETPRVFYLLANRKAVVTEANPDVEIDDDLRSAFVAVPYDGVVSACVDLVRDATRRAELERAGFECIRQRNEARILGAALAAL